MPSVCFYFEVHQPMRLKRFSVFSIGSETTPDDIYFDNELNRNIFYRISKKCYLPTNKMLRELINKYKGRFKVSYSLTGTFVEMCEKYNLQVLDSFVKLRETNCVGFLNETYYHSLSSLYDNLNEFETQIKMHRNMMKEKFDYTPTVFRNTEAIYDNRTAKRMEEMGYKGIITEGTERILSWRSPNYLYNPVNSDIKILLRNYPLSDDIGFRFSAKGWPEHPLTADKFAAWVSQSPGDIINIFIDYETFGEHQWSDTGIFDFLRHLPGELLKYSNIDFVTPDEAVKRYNPVGKIDVPFAVSWADTDRNVSTWLGNGMQVNCFNELKSLEEPLIKKGDPHLLHVWRLLQSSDHLYYVSTKGMADGDVHKYFNPFKSPYEGFINYMNIIQDLKQRVDKGRKK